MVSSSQSAAQPANPPRRHTFDVARQGYVNLLPVQHKKSKTPGDSPLSVQARQRFLADHHYQPLRQQLVSQIQQCLSDLPFANESHSWLDIGCGEGYYTQAIAELGCIEQLFAIDISKAAVAELAKAAKTRQQLWYQPSADQPTRIYPMVASAAHLPIANASLSGISSVFSPILPAEFARVLKPHGVLVIVKPAVGHLASVRQALFEQVREHDSDKFLQLAGFQHVASRQIQVPLMLDSEALKDLLTMTPYSYRAKRERRQQLLADAAIQGFATEARFVLSVLKKQPSCLYLTKSIQPH